VITSQLDPSAELLKSLSLPVKGTWKTLPPHLLPDIVLQDSLNVTLLDGKLRHRLGLGLATPDTFNGPIIGSFLFIAADGTKYVLASTANRLYQTAPGAFTDITGAATLTGTSTQVSMTSIQIGTSVYLLYANGVDVLKYKTDGGTLSDITPNSGTLPICTDICTTFSRIVGVTPPYVVQWCDVLNPSYLSFREWPALNQVVLSDTEDAIVAIKPLGTLGFVVYKEGNIFVGIAQAGAPSQAFRFEHRGEYEGPAGIQSIINTNGVHVYFTRTGRVGVFDGSKHEWVCDGLWPFLRDDVDPLYVQNSFGIYNYTTNEIYFWYPRVGDLGAIKGMLIINMSMPLAGITDVAYFKGLSNFAVSNGLSVRVFQSGGIPYIFSNKPWNLTKGNYYDNGERFNCSFKTGLSRVLEQDAIHGKRQPDIIRPIFEFYAVRDSTRNIVNISAITSNQLEDNGTVSPSVTVDLSTISPNEYIGFNDTGSFVGLQATWSSDALVEYKGCDIYFRRTQ
jgi:hypothetical protein